jgi:hypothetical protein
MSMTQFVKIAKAPKTSKNCIGYGNTQGFGADSADQIAAMFNQALRAPVYALPEVAKVQWYFGGPVSQSQSNSLFGTTVNILNTSQINAAAGGIDVVYSTEGLINGEFQSFVLACMVGYKVVPDPFQFTVRGNSFVRPTTPGIKPFSPDAWTLTNDAGGGNAAGTAWTASKSPNAKALLWWGGWINRALWDMVRAYNLVWSQGQLITLINEQLRDTAYMPNQSQEGSASLHQLGTIGFVNNVNTRYTQLLASLNDFGMIDTLRVGSFGAGAANQGIFVPNNDFDFVDTTTGGADVESALCNNAEYRTLTVPFLLKPGVNIGMTLQVQNVTLANNMRALLDAASVWTPIAGGVVPPAITESPDFLAGVGSAFVERSIDANNVSQTVTSTWHVYKGGEWFNEVDVKGYEVADDIGLLLQSNTALRQQLCSNCNCMVGWPT